MVPYDAGVYASCSDDQEGPLLTDALANSLPKSGRPTVNVSGGCKCAKHAGGLLGDSRLYTHVLATCFLHWMPDRSITRPPSSPAVAPPREP